MLNKEKTKTSQINVFFATASKLIFMANNPTAAQARWHAKAREYGCMACRIILAEQGQDPDDVPGCNLHHVLRHGHRDHDMFFGCCLQHHQDGDDAIHRNKLEFVRKFGTEEELMLECFRMIGKPFTKEIK